MRSNKLLKKAEDIVKNNPHIFEELMEFENTKKIRTKERLNFTIDRAMASRFKKFCREKGYNMSAKIEQAIERIVESG